MKILILAFILLTSSIYADTCTNYFHTFGNNNPFRIMRVEDLSEAEYDILENIARFELEARTTQDAHLRNSRLEDLNTHFEYLAQSKIDLAVYYKIRESVLRNESSKIKDRKKRIQEQEAALAFEIIQELDAQLIIGPIIKQIERFTSLRGDSLQSLFDQALAMQPNSPEQIEVFEMIRPIFQSKNEYVRRKISIESKNKALEVAIHTNSFRDSYAQDLLNFGANPDSIATNGMTMLHYAILQKNKEVIRILLEHKANINSVFESNSILHTAVENKDDTNVRLLLEHGANVHATNKDGETPLHLAAKIRFWNPDSLLEYGANVHATNKDGDTPLHLAVKSHFEKVQRILENGANVNATNKDGETPLHFAVKSENSDSLQILLNHGASVNVFNKEGETPLHFAAERRSPRMISALIESGANPHAKNKQGETPLYRAVLKGESEWVVSLLLEISNKNAASLTGQTPFKIAISKDYRNKNIQYLLKYGTARLHKKLDRERYVEYAKKLAQHLRTKLGTTLRKLTTPSNQKKP